MSIFATGNNTQAYVGVRASTPPNMNQFQRDPNATDRLGYVVGDFWQNYNTQHTFILTSLAGSVGHWSLIDAAAGDLTNFITGDGNTVLPNLGNITFQNSTNINTTGNPNLGNFVQVNLNNSILLPATTSDELNGVISIGGFPFLHAFNSPTNTFLGSDAGNFNILLSGDNNTGIGNDSLSSLTSGNFNTGLGSGSGLVINVGNNNTLLGYSSGNSLVSGDDNTALGYQSLFTVTTGIRNTSIGSGASFFVSTGSSNIALGFGAGSSVQNNNNNIHIGNPGMGTDASVIKIGTNATHNTCFIAGIDGVNVASTAKVVTENADQLGTAVITAGGGITVTPGANTITIASTGSVVNNINLPDTNTGGTQGVIEWNSVPYIHNYGPGANNIFVGRNAGNTVVTLTGGNNSGLGNLAGNALTTGLRNTLIGNASGSTITTGTRNTAIGYNSLITLITGGSNIALGNTAGNSYTGAESSNIIIGNLGIIGESNIIRIGTSGSGTGQQNQCFIAGIAGVTTTVADAVPVLISASTGQLGTISSSKRYKENIEDMCCESSNVMQLKPVTFTYKNDPTYRLQYGLIAEEVAEIFPRLVVFNADGSAETVKYHELPILLLNEIQKLNQRINDLENKLDMV